MTTRKHAFYGILALVSLLGLGITQSARANLVTNPGFETGDFSGWGNGGFAVVGPTSGISPHSGSHQAECLSPPNGGLLFQSFATIVGQSYTGDFWLAGASGGSFIFSVDSTIFFHQSFPASGYTEFTFNFTATDTSSQLFLQAAGDLFFDDFSVEPAGVGVPDAGSTLPLLGFASLGLVAMRRKLRC